jgi:hypothetical protein
MFWTAPGRSTKLAELVVVRLFWVVTTLLIAGPHVLTLRPACAAGIGIKIVVVARIATAANTERVGHCDL